MNCSWCSSAAGPGSCPVHSNLNQPIPKVHGEVRIKISDGTADNKLHAFCNARVRELELQIDVLTRNLKFIAEHPSTTDPKDDFEKCRAVACLTLDKARVIAEKREVAGKKTVHCLASIGGCVGNDNCSCTCAACLAIVNF